MRRRLSQYMQTFPSVLPVCFVNVKWGMFIVPPGTGAFKYYLPLRSFFLFFFYISNQLQNLWLSGGLACAEPHGAVCLICFLPEGIYIFFGKSFKHGIRQYRELLVRVGRGQKVITASLTWLFDEHCHPVCVSRHFKIQIIFIQGKKLQTQKPSLDFLWQEDNCPSFYRNYWKQKSVAKLITIQHLLLIGKRKNQLLWPPSIFLSNIIQNYYACSPLLSELTA